MEGEGRKKRSSMLINAEVGRNETSAEKKKDAGRRRKAQSLGFGRKSVGGGGGGGGGGEGIIKLNPF